MADLRKITRELLNSALTEPSLPLAKRLPKGELKALGIILARMAKRYPSQENADTIVEYLADFEQLALKYSLQRVAAAIDRLRIRPGQTFFPKPDEVADEIEATFEKSRYAVDDAAYRAQRAEMDRIMTDPDEIAWRKQHFGENA